MRIYVPRAIHAINYASRVDSYWEGSPYSAPPMTRRIMNGVCLPADTIQLEDGSYFWDTHHRPMNDCVHSKLVSVEDVEIVPNGVIMINNNEYIYSRKFYHYGAFAYPYTDMDDSTVCSMIDSVYLNDNHVSYSVEIAAAWDAWNIRKPYVDFQIRIKFYYCSVEQYSYPTIPRFDTVINLRMAAEASEVKQYWYQVYPISKQSSYIWNFAGGNQTVRSHFWNLWLNAEPTVCSLLTGLTKYYRNGGWEYYSGASRNILKEACDYILRQISVYPAYGRRSKWKNWDYYTYKGVDLKFPEPVPPSDRFLFHEDDRIQEGIDPFLIDNSGLQNYWWNVLVQQAYLDTLDSVPRLNENSISNIIEIAGFIKSLLIDHKIDLPKSLGDMWLSYRYQYTTTKLDAEEAISFMHRHRELGTLDQWIHCFGASHIDFDNGRFSTHVTCRCGLEIRPSDVAMLGKVWRALYTYGLQPNFYVVWDMIPYSFIVDWLIPVGNFMHALDAEGMYDGTYYEIKNIVFSISYDIRDKYANEYHQYTRWVQNDIPQLNGFYFFEEDPVSTKVKGMRILDTLSLFIGRRK